MQDNAEIIPLWASIKYEPRRSPLAPVVVEPPQKCPPGYVAFAVGGAPPRFCFRRCDRLAVGSVPPCGAPKNNISVLALLCSQSCHFVGAPTPSVDGATTSEGPEFQGWPRDRSGTDDGTPGARQWPLSREIF